MGCEKDEDLRREKAAYEAARRDGRRYPYCGAVIPYGEALGPNGEGPECVGALRDD